MDSSDIDSFTKENKWSGDLLDSFNKFKMLIYYDFVYYGGSLYLKNNKDIFNGISLKLIDVSRPIKEILFSYFALCHYWGFDFFITLINYLRKLKS